MLSKLRIESSGNTTGVARIHVSTNHFSVEFSEPTFKLVKYPCSISKNHKTKQRPDRMSCSARHLLLHRPLYKQQTVPADMYRAIRSFILSPNKHCSNIFTSIFRAIKPQGLTKHLQTTATRPLHHCVRQSEELRCKTERSKRNLMFRFKCIIPSYIYIKKTNLIYSSSMFIGNCKIALHVSAAFCVHLQEH